MELAFNEVEQRLLRFLKQEYLEKGSRPTNMHAPATMHGDVMERLGIDASLYREIVARLEVHGIVRAIAIDAPNGHLQIDPAVVEVVRQLDEHAAHPRPAPNRLEQAKGYFVTKRWFVVVALALVVLTAVATAVASLKTILEWLGMQP